MRKPTAILLVSCPDQLGLIHAITEFLYQHHGNIVQLSEHVERPDNIFFFRVEWELDTFGIPQKDIEKELKKSLFSKYQMRWELYFTHEKPKMAVFASQSSHCIYDIFSRYFSDEWFVDIPAIISNHRSHEELAQKYGIPFHYFEINAQNKAEQEAQQLKLLQHLGIDFLVLARYMQILSPEFVTHYQNNIINIHHSFLPAFAGAKPYHRAFERGVKIIGATSHYVTQNLDEGPIIEQSVTKVSHKDSIEDLKIKGRDIEKLVLSRAISLHLQRRVLVHNNKTVVFE
jgi:formyltetrahydrofolate deformylase